MISNLTQDSGIHTMSSRRDSAFSDGVLNHNFCVSNLGQPRKANSDCYPMETPYATGRLTQSMEYLNQYPNSNSLQQNIGYNACSYGVKEPIFSNYGSNCTQDNYGSISQCSNHHYHPNDPGGGKSVILYI